MDAVRSSAGRASRASSAVYDFRLSDTILLIFAGQVLHGLFEALGGNFSRYFLDKLLPAHYTAAIKQDFKTGEGR